MKKNNKLLDLNFEDEESVKLSIKIMKKEFIKKNIKIFLAIIATITFYGSYLIINHLYKASYGYSITTFAETDQYTYSLNLTLTWSVFSICIFLSIYLIRLLYLKFTPSVVKYLKKEFEFIGFQFQRRYDSGIIFLILNILSITLLTYFDFNLLYFFNSSTSFFIRNIIFIYLFLSLVIPIIWGFWHDKFLIKLKNKFFITFDFQFNLLNKKGIDPNLIGIFLTSNRLCSRFNKLGKENHREISEVRWLPRKKKIFSISSMSPYLHFYEFSALTNIQSQFLNIALALRDFNHQKMIPSGSNYVVSVKNPDWKIKLRLLNQVSFYRFFNF